MRFDKKKIIIFLLVVLIFISGIYLGIYLDILKLNNKELGRLQEGEIQKNISRLKDTQKAFAAIAEDVIPAVVNISTTRIVKSSGGFGFNDEFFKDTPFHDFFDDEFFKRFFKTPERKYKQQSLGSGVIVDRKGYILTNNHVIANADEIKITLSDKREFKGKVIGTDPKTDLAIVKIDGSNLPVVRLGDSDNIKVGEWAIAIGNPFGLNQTVTLGIISAKGRANIGIVDYEDFIQTDAAINPGNSGGALLNIDGEVIGINTAIFSRSGGYQGIGFAIPINMAKKIMGGLLSSGKITRGWLGITIQDVNEELAKKFNLKSNKGVIVNGFTSDSPAGKAGIKTGDVIIEFDGKGVKDVNHLRSIVASTKVGKTVNLTVMRNGKKINLSVNIGEMPSDSKIALAKGGETTSGKGLGIKVKTLTQEIAKELGYEGDKGVVVVEVEGGSNAEEKGIQNGDLIKEANKKPVPNVTAFLEQVNKVKKGDNVLLYVRNKVSARFVVIPGNK